MVDNHSQDGSLEMVRKEFPQVRLIENSTNWGFARANNIGFGVARGEYILLLNSDTKVMGDALEKLVSFLDSHYLAGVATARLVYPDFSDQGVARTFPTPYSSYIYSTNEKIVDAQQDASPVSRRDFRLITEERSIHGFQ